MDSNFQQRKQQQLNATGTVTAVCQATNTMVFSVWSVLYQVNNAGWILQFSAHSHAGISAKKETIGLL